MVEWLFFMVPWGCMLFVIVVFPDRTHYFLHMKFSKNRTTKTLIRLPNAQAGLRLCCLQPPSPSEDRFSRTRPIWFMKMDI